MTDNSITRAALSLGAFALLGGAGVAVNESTHLVSATYGDCFTVPASARYCVTQDGAVGLVRSGQPVHSVVWLYWDNGVHVVRGDGAP